MHRNKIHLFCQFNWVFGNSTLYFKCFSEVEMTGAFLLPSPLGDNPLVRRSGSEQSFLHIWARKFPKFGVLPHQKHWLCIRLLGFCCLHTPMWIQSRSHFSCLPPSGRTELTMVGVSETSVKSVGLMMLNPESTAIFWVGSANMINWQSGQCWTSVLPLLPSPHIYRFLISAG